MQACVPHRRLLPAGCESVTFSGRAALGAVEIRAVAVPSALTGQDPAGPHAPAEIPRPRRAASPGPSRAASEVSGRSGSPAVIQPLRPPAEHVWDVEAVDATGRALVTWRRLRLRDAGPLPRNAAWPPSLLSVYLERSVAPLGLDPALRVAVECGQPDGIPLWRAPATVKAEPSGQPASQPAMSLPKPDARKTAGRPATSNASSGEQPATSQFRTVAGTGQLEGFTLRVRAADAVECGWAAANSPQGANSPHCAQPTQGTQASQGAGPDAELGLAEVKAQIRSRLSEPPATIAARLQAVSDCLAAARTPARCPVTLRDATTDDWVLLSVAGASVACTVVEISGVPCPVAIAIMTGTPGPDPTPPARAQRAARKRARHPAARS